MRADYIFMDLDGTISDSKEEITKAVAYALASYGIEKKILTHEKRFLDRRFLI